MFELSVTRTHPRILSMKKTVSCLFIQESGKILELVVNKCLIYLIGYCVICWIYIIHSLYMNHVVFLNIFF